MNDSEERAMLSALVPVALRDDLRLLAQRRDRSLSGEVREALRRHLCVAEDADGSGGFRPVTPRGGGPVTSLRRPPPTGKRQMARESWRLGEPSWYQEPRRRTVAVDAPSRLPSVRIRSAPSEMPVMVGRFASFDEWVEINSKSEGHFLESMGRTAFEKTVLEDRDRIRVLFHHGMDSFFGHAVLGPIRALDANSEFEVPLLRTDYNERLIPQLKSGQLGASFRFSVVRDEVRQRPPRSTRNPKALAEVTVTEARVAEFGPTPLPAYKSTVAGVRSSSAVELYTASRGLLPGERWRCRAKPGCPGVVERQRVADGDQADWEEDRPDWMLEDLTPQLPPPWRRSWWLDA